MKPDDELTPVDADDADDALLDAIAAGATETAAGTAAPGAAHALAPGDPAARLLAGIAEAAAGLEPRSGSDEEGRRRARHRGGGMWGISLGVAIVVAGSGGLSAAATDHLPGPVQRIVTDVGQALPAAQAATPTVLEPPAAGDASAGSSDARTGAPAAEPAPRTAPWFGPVSRPTSPGGPGAPVPTPAVPDLRWTFRAPSPYPTSYWGSPTQQYSWSWWGSTWSGGILSPTATAPTPTPTAPTPTPTTSTAPEPASTWQPAPAPEPQPGQGATHRAGEPRRPGHPSSPASTWYPPHPSPATPSRGPGHTPEPGRWGHDRGH